ncbi:MAG: transketolase C-terminal domain-containing protein [Chloroflexota bacterium]|nr:transketolase C-terminal domain-containing protein [Chloroflexota bacterium]
MNAIRQQFADTMLSIGKDDPDLVVLVGDISHGILQPFANACPGRYFNVGICEPTIVSMAAGLSKVGFHPVVHTIAPFIIERSYEQIKLDFCYQRLGGNLVTVGAAFDYGNLGCTHHCYGDFALVKALPDTQITFPASIVEFDALFRQAYRNDFLTLFRIPGYEHDIQFNVVDIQFGSAIKVADGHNLTFIVTGPELSSALAARDALRAFGWDIEVVYIHTIRPLDTEMIIASVQKTRRVLVIEEHMRSGGLGDDVIRATRGIPDIQYLSLSIPDQFVTGYGTWEDHCRDLGFTQEGIVECVTTYCGSGNDIEQPKWEAAVSYFHGQLPGLNVQEYGCR